LARLREVERKVAIRKKLLDDFKPKRLEDAITVVGTCPDMCSRAERYRRENEMLLVADIENVPGDRRRVDHTRAVTRYERGVGDKVVPSDLRPGPVLVMTLNYLIHQLLPEIGFEASAGYISDRTRAIRSDMTIQHMVNITAMEINHRIVRHHILTMHLMRGTTYNIALEEQRMMNTLQTLKECYEDYRQPEKDPNYTSPHEIEMRVYQRLSHIRDQVARKDYIPPHVAAHPIFAAVNDFRQHVQKLSAPISKTSKLLVDKENKKSQKVETIGRDKFMQLVSLLQQLPNGQIVVYMVVCLMEHIFKESELQHLGITDIEALRGGLDWPDLIEGLIAGQPEPVASALEPAETQYVSSEDLYEPEQYDEEGAEDAFEDQQQLEQQPAPAQHAQQPFFGQSSTPSVFGNSSAPSPFGQTSTSAFGQPSTNSVFGRQPTTGFFGSQPASQSQNPFHPSFEKGEPRGSVFGSASSSGFGFGIKPSPSSLNPDAKPFVFPAQPAAPTSVFPAPSSGIFSSPLPSSSTTATTEPAKPKSLFSTPLFGPTPAPPSAQTPAAQAPQSSSATAPSTTGFPTGSLFGQPPAHSQSSQPAAPASRPLFGDAPVAGPSKEASALVFGPPKPPVADANPFKARNPSPLKIEILPSEDTRAPEADEERPMTATEPPPLEKVHTISLPSTPTSGAAPFAVPGPSTPTGAAPGTPGANRLLSRLQTAEAPKSPSGALSPLQLNSPTLGSFPFPATPSAKAKGKQPEQSPLATHTRQENIEPEADPDEMVRSFLARSQLVKVSFKKWVEKAVASGEYKDAIRKAEEYHEKVRRQSHLRRSMNSSTSSSPGKKRVFEGLSQEEIKRKRAKRRSTGYKPPVTDEELAERFRAQREEHQRTWAPGSFLQALRAQQEGHFVPPEFRIWLSLNQIHDGTAIWLEKKFNMPDSGKWETETVFSVPLDGSVASDASGYPGLIVFECTPLEGLEDELERKYRVLDDCARLRDILKGMPEDRHFLPSLLFVLWTSNAESSLPPDLADMVRGKESHVVIGAFGVLPMASASGDMDKKFSEVASKISLDLEGKYVHRWTFAEVLRTLEPRIAEFFEDRLERCIVYGRFDWMVYGQLVKSVIEMLNDAARISLQLVGVQDFDPLPAFDKEITSDDSAYELALNWLAEVHPADLADQIGADIIAHRDMEREFPTSAFLDNILKLTWGHAEEQLAYQADAVYHVMVDDHEEALAQFRDATISQVATLEHDLTLRTRRSPAKRRSPSEVTETSMMLKRRRMSSGQGSSVLDGTNALTPSTSMSSTSPETPSSSSTTVTAAMLRELTRNMKQKYCASR
ncbi:SAC3/GANP/Nin1/mts3/eIF-3 p25 family-domain-containing protein, partial [Schizophyllum fasciatum]